jgi:hypothetical protein
MGIFSKIIILKYLDGLDDFINTLNEITIIEIKRENHIIQLLPMEQHKKRYIVLAVVINIYIIIIGGRAFYEILKRLGYI